MGRILGIDYGLKRIGLAISDPLHIIASPLKTITVHTADQVMDELAVIISEQEVDQIILGLPIGMKGQETEQTGRIREFAETLKGLNVPIDFQDERLSSVSAKRSMMSQNIKTGHNKALIDQRAAAIMLQQYLDTKRF